MPTSPDALARGFQTYGIALYGLALTLLAVVVLFTLLMRAKDKHIERLEEELARREAIADAAIKGQLALAVSTATTNRGNLELFEYLKALAMTPKRRRGVGEDTGSHPVLPSALRKP